MLSKCSVSAHLENFISVPENLQPVRVDTPSVVRYVDFSCTTSDVMSLADKGWNFTC